jgi:hypothetical protein
MYASPNIIQVIKSRRLRCVGHVARIEEMHTIFRSENLKGRDHSEDVDIDGKLILKYV